MRPVLRSNQQFMSVGELDSQQLFALLQTLMPDLADVIMYVCVFVKSSR